MLATHFVGATDTPVWFLFGATAALVIVTIGLVWAAFKALGQLRVARTQLELAVRQLDEAAKDRHTGVLLDFCRRWDGASVKDALRLERKYGSDLLAVVSDATTRSRWKKRKRERAEADLAVLLAVPDYFEDMAVISELAALEMTHVAKIFKGLALDEWDNWEPAIVALRETRDPYSYTQFERLVRNLRRVPDE
jgi:hypothetical protein